MAEIQNPVAAKNRVGDTKVQPSTRPPAASDAPAKPPIVELKNVCKWFDDERTGGRLEALENFNFVVEHEEAGEFLTLLGPSGCGKSTILALISGLALPDAGEVRIFGEPIKGPSSHSATVPQAYTCFPWLTVVENVEFGLRMRGKSKREQRETALHYLERVGLEGRRNSYPKQLSGGMQQRVAIARTLAMKLPIVLMDEPFGALDAQTRCDMQQMVLQLWEVERNTIIFVTHDISEALLLGDRVILFSSRARVIWEKRNLDVEFGHQRQPSLAQDRRFVDLCEELREKLRDESLHGRREESP